MTREGIMRKLAHEISIEGKLQALEEYGAAELLTLPTILTVDQVAYIFQINIATMRKIVKEPSFFPKFRIGKSIRISRDALIEWISEHCRDGEQIAVSDDDEW